MRKGVKSRAKHLAQPFSKVDLALSSAEPFLKVDKVDLEPRFKFQFTIFIVSHYRMSYWNN